MKRMLVILALVSLLPAGCGPGSLFGPALTLTPSSTPTPKNTPTFPPTYTPTTATQPAVMADTFFSGCAYLDQNDNGAIDPGEPLLGGMTFTVTLQGGGGFGDLTSEGQCASIIIPAALAADAWPIRARMAVPEDAAYEPIGPSEVTLEYPHTKADFLFTAK